MIIRQCLSYIVAIYVFFDSLCGSIDVSRFAILDDGRWRCSLNVSASCRLVRCYRITLLLTRLVGIFWSLSDFVGGQEPVPKPLEILATRRELQWAGYCRIVFICCAARRTADNSSPHRLAV